MKKIICAFLICVFAAGLAACAQTSSSSSDSGKSGFKAVVNGNIEIEPGKSAAEAIEALGEPKKYTEAASCYFDGMDKVFNYGSFEIRTYPSEGGDMVQDVCIMEPGDRAVGTGISVGSGIDEVVAAYGVKYRLVGKMYRYYYDDVRYTYFFVIDDKVKYFGYAIDVKN